MKLLFIRHGDPDYTIDSLTEKGWKEAEFLSEKIAALDVRDFYVSPLGRAKDTASCTLKKNGRTATECKWLREFDVKIRRPDLHGEKIIPWDWLPQDWTKIENFYIARLAGSRGNRILQPERCWMSVYCYTLKFRVR